MPTRDAASGTGRWKSVCSAALVTRPFAGTVASLTASHAAASPCPPSSPSRPLLLSVPSRPPAVPPRSASCPLTSPHPVQTVGIAPTRAPARDAGSRRGRVGLTTRAAASSSARPLAQSVLCRVTGLIQFDSALRAPMIARERGCDASQPHAWGPWSLFHQLAHVVSLFCWLPFGARGRKGAGCGQLCSDFMMLI